MLEGFENRSDWTVSGSGTGLLGCARHGQRQGRCGFDQADHSRQRQCDHHKACATWDLSANQGNFRLWVYVSGTSEPTGGSIILSTDSSFSNYFITSYGGAFKLRYKPGWNLINLRTSDWKVGKGSPNWANIVRIRIRLDSKSVNTYSFDGLTSGVVAQPAVIFTFDKGLSSLYSQAFSYMQTHNVRGTGYIPTNLVGTYRSSHLGAAAGDVCHRVDDRQPDDVECRSDNSAIRLVRRRNCMALGRLSMPKV